MISFIVPAHNEEFFLPKTLGAIHATARGLELSYEVVVVDDASTDRTSAVAQEMGARVLNVNHRQIAATRNSGARAARGELLFFVDADTTVTPQAVSSALKRLETGVVGGGALTYFEDAVPMYARLLLAWFGFFLRIASLSGGAFLFCAKRAFDAVGGFDERLYGAEDAAFSAALKKEGRFVVLRERVPTSGRRVRSVTGLRILGLLVQIAILPSNLKNRRKVERVWYESNRSSQTAGQSVFGRMSNFCALIIMLVLILIPIWAVPWPKVLLAGPLGQLRHFCGILVTHVGLVLWPCMFFLSRTFFEQGQFKERVKTGLLILVCLLLAIGSALRVLDFWRSVFNVVRKWPV
jgi:cellulose synthase/poly-beta-1,6-N-acetylglucosamine synthase-like glycosyltransferase